MLMKKLDKVVVAGIQESVTNATSLAGAIALVPKRKQSKDLIG